MSGEGIDLFGDCKIPRGDAVRFEESDLLFGGTAGDFAGDELI